MTSDNRAKNSEVAQLTIDEVQAREKAIDFYRYVGKSDTESIRLAWRDLQKAFPRLQEFEAAAAESAIAAASSIPNQPQVPSAERLQKAKALGSK
jgi:hypothetical protein